MMIWTVTHDVHTIGKHRTSIDIYTAETRRRPCSWERSPPDVGCLPEKLARL